MSNKSPADKIKEAAAGETDPKALSQAAATSGPPGASGPNDTPLKGDGKAPYREDFEAVYHRLANLEAAVKLLNDRLGSDTPDSERVSLEQRLSNIETRLDDAKRAHPLDDLVPKSVEDRVTEIERRLEGNIA